MKITLGWKGGTGVDIKVHYICNYVTKMIANNDDGQSRVLGKRKREKKWRGMREVAEKKRRGGGPPENVGRLNKWSFETG